jgi:hypothetical protein
MGFQFRIYLREKWTNWLSAKLQTYILELPDSKLDPVTGYHDQRLHGSTQRL